MLPNALDAAYVVKLPSGEARFMNVDELNSAFAGGMLHAASPVLAPGAIAWTTLGVLAGLNDAEISPPSPQNFASIPPTVIDAAAGAPAAAGGARPVAQRSRSKLVGIAFAIVALCSGAFVIKAAENQSRAARASEAAAAKPADPPPPAATALPVPPPPAVVLAAPSEPEAATPPPAPPTKKGKLAGAKKRKR